MGQWITDLAKWLAPYEHPLATIASIATLLGVASCHFLAVLFFDWFAKPSSTRGVVSAAVRKGVTLFEERAPTQA